MVNLFSVRQHQGEDGEHRGAIHLFRRPAKVAIGMRPGVPSESSDQSTLPAVALDHSEHDPTGQSLERHIARGDRLQPQGVLIAHGLEEALVDRAKQRILVGEAAIDHADRDAGGLRDCRHGRRIQASMFEQRLGGRQEAMEGVTAASLLVRH